jgi:hypothetical protein
MSNRTLVELNHDYCPTGSGFKDSDLIKWATAFVRYMQSGEKNYLPKGVTFKHMRHHSEPEPVAGAADVEKLAREIAGGVDKLVFTWIKEIFPEQVAESKGRQQFVDLVNQICVGVLRRSLQPPPAPAVPGEDSTK